MSAHDPLCDFAMYPPRDLAGRRCHCDLIKRVRADERETLIRRVEAEIHHAADNGHMLDWRCQGVMPDEVVPAVRVDFIRAAIAGAFRGLGTNAALRARPVEDPAWQPMAEIVRNATMAADAVAMQPLVTGAARTRAVVERAIEFCVGNGLLTVTDRSTWPEWLVLDPPFQSTAPLAGGADGTTNRRTGP